MDHLQVCMYTCYINKIFKNVEEKHKSRQKSGEINFTGFSPDISYIYIKKNREIKLSKYLTKESNIVATLAGLLSLEFFFYILAKSQIHSK